MKEKIIEKRQYLLLAGLIFLFAAVYLSLCFNNNIWTDEAFTVELLRTSDSFMDAVRFTAGDVHPPLYYLILKCFTDLFGIHLLLLKVLSVIPMLLTMGLGISFVYKRFNFRTAFLYIAMLGVIPFSMEYAVQVRMYSWALLFVTVCGFYGINALEKGRKRDWLVMILAGTAAAYTHYFAFVAVIWIYGFLFLALLIRNRKRLLYWLVSVAASLILYVPWMISLRNQLSGVSSDYWIEEITGTVIWSYFDTLFENNLPYSTLLLQILFGTAVLWLGCRIVRYRTKEDVYAFLGIIVLAATAATGVVVSNLMRPVFIARYLLPCIGVFVFGFAVCMARLPKKTYGLLLVFCLFLGMMDYEKTFEEEYRIPKTPQTEEFFRQNLGENDIVAYNFKEFDFIYAYYFEPEKLIYVEDVDLSQNYDDIWLLDTHYNPEFSKEELEQYGWKQYFEGNFGIEHDEFKIYRITKNQY